LALLRVRYRGHAGTRGLHEAVTSPQTFVRAKPHLSVAMAQCPSCCWCPPQSAGMLVAAVVPAPAALALVLLLAPAVPVPVLVPVLVLMAVLEAVPVQVLAQMLHEAALAGLPVTIALHCCHQL
jgi:hypothetical protein